MAAKRGPRPGKRPSAPGDGSPAAVYAWSKGLNGNWLIVKIWEARLFDNNFNYFNCFFKDSRGWRRDNFDYCGWYMCWFNSSLYNHIWNW